MQTTIDGLRAAKALVKTEPRKAILDALDLLTNPFLSRGHSAELSKILSACDGEERRIDRAIAFLNPPEFDHRYEPGAFGVCRRCGLDRHRGPGG
ncbi:MAG TPA: hypothetical protein VFW46_20150 [Stellaceae bacterium]|nr:hypothetical protein [Stellaceae bacterium]